MNEGRNNIKSIIVANFSNIMTILLLTHILIGFGFLLHNQHKVDDKLSHKYEIMYDNKKYKSNELYLGNNFVLFFEGKSGTYEKNRNTIKIYSIYNIDTLGKKIIVRITNDTIPN
jgi:hypothetical protein